MSEKLRTIGKLATSRLLCSTAVSSSLRIIVEMTLIIKPSSGCSLSGKEVMRFANDVMSF